MDDLRSYLVSNRLAGDVATSRRWTLRNCAKVVAGNPDYTFGLSDATEASEDEVRSAVIELCGGPAIAGPLDGDGYIDPDATVDAIGVHRERLREFAATGGRYLLATGHPTGLLGHYAAIGRALTAAGCAAVLPLDDVRDVAEGMGVRYLDGVAAPWTGGDLVHTHRSGLMEAMLGALDGPPDLVVADHGFAGAAVEAGIATLSIADVNDPALPLAQARGRTDAVLPIDDNLAPRLFEPVTQVMLDGLGTGVCPTRS